MQSSLPGWRTRDVINLIADLGVASAAVRAFRNSAGLKMDKKTLLIGQLLMTFLMSLSMSGILSATMMGLTAEWLGFWPKQFAIAWPIAFLMTLIWSRVAFPLAGRIRRKLS